MQKALKRRFVLLSMAGMLLITIIVVGAINIFNYVNVKSSVESMIEFISYNDGTVPELNEKKDEETRPGTPEDGDMPGNSDMPGNTGNQPGTESLSAQNIPDEGEEQTPSDDKRTGFNEESRRLIDKGKVEYGAESQYTTRFFSVCFDESGDITSVNIDNIASFTEEEAENIADGIYKSSKTHGWDGSYYFRKIVKEAAITAGETGELTMIIYLDCSSEVLSCKQLLIISLLVALASLVLEFIILNLLSGRVVRPVAESIIKQKEFITDASHELKTPLTIISANTEVIEMMEGKNEWTDSIQKQTVRMTKLVNDMVFLARMDEGGQEAVCETFSLSEAVADVALSFKTYVEGKGVGFGTSFEENLSYKGNEGRVRQLVSILLDNAGKYATENGEINVSLYKKGKHSILEVYNTCDDLGDTDLSMLFERFYRIDKSRSRATGGSGIGLSVAKAIVAADKNMHIEAESPDRRSITFRVTFRENL